ncbi:hypothetical protein BDV12DRAFT_165832 [Aspergillus spectabilis]
MTDYSALKVTDLKAELKRRGIPQTGLRVKQQIIDRLVEEDAKGQNGDADEASTAAEPAPHEESQTVEPEPASEPAPEPEPEVPAEVEKTDETIEAPQETEKIALEAQADSNRVDQQPVEDAAPAPPNPTQTEEPPKQPQESREEDTSIETGDHKSEAGAVIKPRDEDTGAPSNVAQEDIKPVEAARTSGVSTGLSTPLPAEELVEDVRKRKRRSQSPVPSLEGIAREKSKALGASSEEKDTTSAEEVRKRKRRSQSPASGPGEVAMKKAKALGEPTSVEEEGIASPKGLGEKRQAANESLPEEPVLPGDTHAKKSTPQKQDMRFKGLFSSTGREQPRPLSPPVDVEMEDVAVEPASHAATAALYIDGLMRPLQPAALKAHLVAVASPPGKSPNPDLIVDFYLDFIKTHCFARFVDVSTASRARNFLHGTVWPNEKNRRPLFVDFIPEEKVQSWIQREEDARGRRGPLPRWEVKYDKQGDEVEAVLEEVDSKTAGTHTARAPEPKEFTHPPPRGPRAEMQPQSRRPSGPSQASRSSQPGQGFKPLDELFKSTTTKPRLYYLPVARDVADRRLDKFDDLLRKGEFPRRGGDETRKISFEDGDQFVDLGAEFAGRGRGGGRGRGRGGMINSQRDSRRDRY